MEWNTIDTIPLNRPVEVGSFPLPVGEHEPNVTICMNRDTFKDVMPGVTHWREIEGLEEALAEQEREIETIITRAYRRHKMQRNGNYPPDDEVARHATGDFGKARAILRGIREAGYDIWKRSG